MHAKTQFSLLKDLQNNVYEIGDKHNREILRIRTGHNNLHNDN